METNKSNNKINRKIAANTTMLLLLNISKLVFPFITLPYLTRVLSTDCYGVVAYVKAVMNYMQVVVDFGFVLSATKQVVESRNDRDKLNYIVSVNIVAKMLLASVAFVGLMILCVPIPILRQNVLYAVLSFIAVFLTIFLLDFLFRGLEKMYVITIRFVIMKGIATLLTFFIVKNDSDILYIPILDIIGSVVAVVWVFFEVRKEGVSLVVPRINDCMAAIKESAVYFLSNVASTTFNVFNTIVAGIVLTSTEVAFWSVCIQIISAGQAMYTPVSDAVYPDMVVSKDAGLIRRIIKLFTPLIVIGCGLVLVFGKYALLIVGGGKYVGALPALRALVPVLFLGFYAIIFGWPTLGAIGKTKQTTLSTVIAALFQVALIGIAILTGKYSLITMAVIRGMGELLMFIIRFHFFRKYRSEFRN